MHRLWSKDLNAELRNNLQSNNDTIRYNEKGISGPMQVVLMEFKDSRSIEQSESEYEKNEYSLAVDKRDV